MRIISFAWTTPALLAGRKTVTRREWNDAYARRFHEGELVAAYDRSPRFKGKQVAVIQLTRAPYLETVQDTPLSDWEAEGFEYLTQIGATLRGITPRELWDEWQCRPLEKMWVVRFEVVGLVQDAAAEHSGVECFEMVSTSPDSRGSHDNSGLCGPI